MSDKQNDDENIVKALLLKNELQERRKFWKYENIYDWKKWTIAS